MDDAITLPNDSRALRKIGASERQRRYGVIYSLLGDQPKAKNSFDAAIEIDIAFADTAQDSEDRARRLWSIAQTLQARGDLKEALDMGMRASRTANAAKLSGQIERWLADLRNEIHNAEFGDAH